MRTPEEIANDVLDTAPSLSDLGPAIAAAIEDDRLRNPDVVICPRCKAIKAMEDEYPAEVIFTHLCVGDGADAEYIKLTKTHALLVERLVVHAPAVQSYETLIFHIWEGGTYRNGYDGAPQAPTELVKVMTCNIRKKLKELKRHNVRIDTAWGVGMSIHSASKLTMVCRGES